MTGKHDAQVRPLEGVRVIDLSWVLAGPVAGRLLADAGAEVIKVESRKRLDNTRRGKPVPVAPGVHEADSDPLDRVPLFHNLNAGKQSIALDLGTPDGLALLKRLLAISDVVLDNFAPGVMTRLGLGPEVLCAEFPQLVAISLSGTGQTGPLADVPAYAPTVTSLAGLEDLVGYDGEGAEGILGLNLADSFAGLVAFHAILNALWSQRATGRGQFIDYSEMEGICTMLAMPLMDFELNGRVMAPTGNTEGQAAPYGMFPVAGVDQWISLAITNDDEWLAFCAATHRQAWCDDERFATVAGRTSLRLELEQAIAVYTRGQMAGELLARLQAAGVAAGPLHNFGDQLGDAHLRARGLFHEIDIPDIGPHTIYGSPWRLSDTPTQSRSGAPKLGEHTTAILRGLLGIDAAEIARLSAAGVLT